MNDIMIYLPSKDLLAHAINDVNLENDGSKRRMLYETLACRIIEHSNEIKRISTHAE